MSTPVRIGAFVVGLAVLFGAAFGAGKLFEDESPASAGAYRLELTTSAPAQEKSGAEVPVDIAFKVLDDDVVTEFEVRHEKPLHLIAVTTDFGSFEHLHPSMAADGTWSISAPLRPGDWRLYADFQPSGGEPTVLSEPISVAGDSGTNQVEDLDPRRAVTEDGRYTVDVGGDLAVGGSELTFTVSGPNGPVTDLDPYLGAYGHLVVIRESDMEYLHVHPEDGPAGPQITFGTDVPAAGRYHLYLDFQHRGTVRTAAFVLDAAAAAEAPAEHGGDHGDH